MVISNDDAPLLLWHLAQPSTDLASGVDLLTRLVATEYVSAGVRRIGKNADNARMSQPAPDKLAIPGAAIRSTRKQKSQLMEALNHGVGGVLLLKQFEDRSNRALYLLVWVENDLVAVEYQTNREKKTQLPLLRLVEFTAVEARANDMQFGLSECSLHAKDEAVVEIGRVVTTIAIEHQGLGNGT